MALDSGECRDAAVFDGTHGTAPEMLAVARLSFGRRRLGGLAAVRSGREAGTSPGHDDQAYIEGRLERHEQVAEFFEHALVDCVAGLGPIQEDTNDVAIAFGVQPFKRELVPLHGSRLRRRSEEAPRR